MAANIQSNILYQQGIWSIAQDKNKLDNFLTSFANALEKGDPEVEISKFTHRQGGYIAKFPVDNSHELHQNKDTFVLKFEPNNHAFNEKFGSRILNELGFITPKVKLIKSEKRNGKAILDTFYSALKLYKNKLDPDYLVFMPAFQAKDMKELVKTKELEKLSRQNLVILFRKIGELAIYDLLIGYNDRFFNLELDVEKDIFSTPYFNGGNIMIALPSENEFKILAIDNSPSQFYWVPKLYKVCKSAFSHVVKEGHGQEFAKHILRGLPGGFDFPDVFPVEDAEKFLLEGIHQGCQQLKHLDYKKFCQSLASHAKGSRAQDTLKLIEENLSILQN